MAVIVAFFVALVVFDLLALRLGADSRDDRRQAWW
jgi:hypothetical protein